MLTCAAGIALGSSAVGSNLVTCGGTADGGATADEVENSVTGGNEDLVTLRSAAGGGATGGSETWLL